MGSSAQQPSLPRPGAPLPRDLPAAVDWVENLNPLCAPLAALMADHCDDPFAAIPELEGFDVRAGDGHYHAAACHDVPVRGSDGKEMKWEQRAKGLTL